VEIQMTHLVFLGDSIFDNAAYVDKDHAFIDHLKGILLPSWQASLVAVDGHTSVTAMDQVKRIPQSATHLFLSVGGNDALMAVEKLRTRVSTVMEGLSILNELQSDFRDSYRGLLDAFMTLEKPLAVCTIYDAIPGLPQELTCALSLFNDVILREAIRRGLPVLDLRTVCTSAEDYSEISPIEPSSIGGQKIAARIVDVIGNHDFKKGSVCGLTA
jgi:hypothetical protein